MKLAVLTPVFNPYRGGIGVVAHANAKMAHEGGMDVTVFTPYYPVFKKKNVHFSEIVDAFSVQRLKPLFSYGNAAVLPQLLLQLRKFDRIHLHYPFLEVAIPVLVARMFWKKPFVLTYHMDLVGKKGLDRFIFGFYTALFLPLLLRHAEKIFISSLDYARASKLAPFLAQYRSKIIVLPHSVDTTLYTHQESSNALREKYDIQTNQAVILFVGGLDSAHYFKGVEYLLEAFEQVVRMCEEARIYPLPKLLLVGYGNLISYFQNIAGQLQISDKVIFAGPVAGESTLASYYSLATATVLASIDSSESFGVVLIESMACETPVIASDLPGIRSVVQDGTNGFLIKPKDVDALAAKLFELVSQKDNAPRLGKAGRSIVEERYSYVVVKKQFLAAMGHHA